MIQSNVCRLLSQCMGGSKNYWVKTEITLVNNSGGMAQHDSITFDLN